jgi:hypothetical protein
MRLDISSALVFLLLISGCAPLSQIGRPVGIPKTTAFKKVIILPPQIDVVEIGAGGVAEKIDDWSEQGRANVIAAIEDELKSKPNLEVRYAPLETLPDNVKAELADTQSLFDVVNSSLVLHVYGPPPHRFEEKLLDFNYSLGNETSKLLFDDADAFLFVKGADQISTAGRKAMQAAAMLAAAAVRVVLIPQLGATALSVALVDARTGAITWFNFDRAEGFYDLRNRNDAASFVKKLLSQFPSP